LDYEGNDTLYKRSSPPPTRLPAEDLEIRRTESLGINLS